MLGNAICDGSYLSVKRCGAPPAWRQGVAASGVDGIAVSVGAGDAGREACLASGELAAADGDLSPAVVGVTVTVGKRLVADVDGLVERVGGAAGRQKAGVGRHESRLRIGGVRVGSRGRQPDLP